MFLLKTGYTKHKYKILIVVLLCIFITFHLKKYHTKKTKYEILQINRSIKDYSKYIDELYPLVILNHNIDDIGNMISPLTIHKKYIEHFNIQIKDRYMYHTKDSFFILSNSNATIYVSLPSQWKHFKPDTYNPYVKTLRPKNPQYSFITIKLKKGNIVSIPRFWIFSINGDVSIFYNHTIFTSFFSIFYIL